MALHRSMCAAAPEGVGTPTELVNVLRSRSNVGKYAWDGPGRPPYAPRAERT